ncbi:DUF167 domain-containing protein [Aurantiacibacter zhengii]|uniref:DUF167 domain-containing protein n=1 Tax=Aurantiacibacter zhengii TaxID=2307003 RepID=A0A418NT32_9SPHN|nr:DUF167 domain-containing protein [Aurantiacibacter zhengii]
MPRPRVEFPPPTALQALTDKEGRLAVRVTPGARSEGIEIRAGRVLVKVRAKPQDGAANEAVKTMLAKALGCAPSHIVLLRGATSREKVFAIAS